jgi:hypothetical protein
LAKEGKRGSKKGDPGRGEKEGGKDREAGKKALIGKGTPGSFQAENQKGQTKAKRAKKKRKTKKRISLKTLEA